MHPVINNFFWIIAVLVSTCRTAVAQNKCLVGDIFHLNGDSIGYSGLECVDDSSFDAMISTCVNGAIVNSLAVMKCDDRVPYCVQCGLRGKGAARCLKSPDDPCIRVDLRIRGRPVNNNSTGAQVFLGADGIIMGSGGMGGMGTNGMSGNIGLDSMETGLGGNVMGKNGRGGMSAKGMDGTIGLASMVTGLDGKMGMGGMMMGMGGMMMGGSYMGGMGSTKIMGGNIHSNHEMIMDVETIMGGSEKGKKRIRNLQTTDSAHYSKQFRGSSIRL